MASLSHLLIDFKLQEFGEKHYQKLESFIFNRTETGQGAYNYLYMCH